MHEPVAEPPMEEDVDDSALRTRHVALEILGLVLDRRQALDTSLESARSFLDLPVRERSFVRMLVTSTVRRLGQIDDLIRRAQDRPDALKSAVLQNVLRLGVTQLFFMVVPDHASVDTSVKLAERVGLERQKGFVNAVLRKLTREGLKWLKAQDAGRLNTPDWLLKVWIADYGLKTAAEIAAAHLTEAPLDITVKNPEDRAYLGNVLRASELNTGTLRRMLGGSVKELEGFDDGRWWVQDAAAALAAQLLGAGRGTHVVDMCAAPGGKTLQLAAMGARVTALDRSAKRMKRLEENLIRMGLKDEVRIEIVDAGAWVPDAPVMKILLDAPCSATGTIRRHPDIVHQKTPLDVQNLSVIQASLLRHAAGILAKGGVLVYCTCSLQKEEGERQIARFLEENPEFSRAKVTLEEIGGYGELIDENGDLRILPFHLAAQGGMDGFYIARLVKGV